MPRGYTVAELVISAPRDVCVEMAYNLNCRTTQGVLAQLISEAKRYLVLAAPFMQENEGLSSAVLHDALKHAVARGVNIYIIGTYKGLQTLDIAGLRDSGNGLVVTYVQEQNRRDKRRIGSHAKFCLADGVRTYIGSANLTGPGLNGHFEMGVLLEGDTAKDVEAFWNQALDQNLFVRVEL